jgi:hypothetical protein
VFSPEDVAQIRAEIERLEEARKRFNDSGILKQIDIWIALFQVSAYPQCDGLRVQGRQPTRERARVCNFEQTWAEHSGRIFTNP